jgi:membrane associated rhomboid family serine protease
LKLPPGPLTNALAIACTAIFALLTLSGLDIAAAIGAGFVPARLDPAGPPVSAATPMLPAALTLITHAFVHIDLFHLFMNMVMLLFIGRQLEAPLGQRSLAVLLLGGTLAGAFAQWTADPASMVPVIGASGAISALVACYAMIFSTVRVRAIGPVPAPLVRAAWLGAAWIVFQLLLGVASGGGVAIWAHIGGFLAGLLIARPLLRYRFRA